MKHLGITSVLLVLTAFTPSPHGWAPAYGDIHAASITPTDVHREVQAVADHIEAIRFYMGSPTTGRASIDIQDAAPHEAIYLASTLFQKVNRLSYELIREVKNEPQNPVGDIAPEDVMQIVQTANQSLAEIVDILGLVVTPSAPHQDQAITPTDVCKEVIQLNRQINLLLEKKDLPADTYQELTRAIGFAARIRSQWPGERIPPPPALQPGKRPADVYRRLIQHHRMVQKIAHRSNIKVLQVEATEEVIAAATPGDVNDLASLISADLAHIDQKLTGPSTPKPHRYPGRMVPSDVYQRAGILGTQLAQILAHEAIESPRDSKDPRP